MFAFVPQLGEGLPDRFLRNVEVGDNGRRFRIHVSQAIQSSALVAEVYFRDELFRLFIGARKDGYLPLPFGLLRRQHKLLIVIR